MGVAKMIQAIQSTRATASLHAPTTLNKVSPTAPLHLDAQHYTDRILTTQNTLSEQEARAALEHLQVQVGQLRKSGLFSNPKIDVNEALERLKKGDRVIVESRLVKGVNGSFKNFEELTLADDLIGRRQDHGVAKPELRLPLLFLNGRKLESYRNSNDDRTQVLDAYTAYQELSRDWRIVIEGKDVKPKDLAAYVVSKGLTASQDQGLVALKRFQQLSAEGWVVNGESVSRDVAYMAFLTGNTRIAFQGAPVASPKDFDLLMNLVANEPNQALDTDVRSRLLSLDLKGFSAPGIANFYNVYQHLSGGQALSYQGNLFASISDVVVFDALTGSKRPTSLLPEAVQGALVYLGQDQGLSTRNAFAAWQAVSKGELISYLFSGGPTGEGLRLTANSPDSVVQMKAQVVAQRAKDQFRPDFREAKFLLAERLPGFSPDLQGNLERSQQAAERARQDLPVQERNLAQAQQDVEIIQPVHDQAQASYEQSERKTRDAERRYNSDKQAYDWKKTDYDRVQRDYDFARRDYDRAIASVRRYEDLARQEDRLVSSDPQNADAHRQKAAQYRSQAQSSQGEANRRQNDMQRLRFDLDRQRWDLDRLERQMHSSRNIFWDARAERDSRKNEWQLQASRLNEAKGRMQQAQSRISLAQRTIAEAETIEKLTVEARQALQTLSRTSAALGNYSDFARERPTLEAAARTLQAVFTDPLYSTVHGNSLHNRLKPVQTLLTHMSKPAPQA